MRGYGYSLDEMLSDVDGETPSPYSVSVDGADAGASGRAGGDSSGDPENDWWIAVVAGAAVGLGVLSVGFCVYAGCLRRRPLWRMVMEMEVLQRLKWRLRQRLWPKKPNNLTFYSIISGRGRDDNPIVVVE